MAASGPGFDNLQRVLWGHATHPNVGAAVFVGLGCEVMQVARMKSAFGSSGAERFHGLTIQDTGGTTKTIARIVEQIHALLPEVNAITREPIPASELKVALECGGSDGFSGITANPALGVASDLLVGLGGTAILAETPEIYGAEQLLLRRAVCPEVGAKAHRPHPLVGELHRASTAARWTTTPPPATRPAASPPSWRNPSAPPPRAARRPLTDVFQYAEQVTTPGFVFMDTPGYDPVATTGQIAGGAQVVVFTTGRGSAFGSKPAPTIKVATNDRLYAQMPDDMDINCGDIVSQGVTIQEKGAEILEKILAVASGEKTKSEGLGLGDNEFVPWQVGAVM